MRLVSELIPTTSLEQQLYTHLQLELSMCIVMQLTPTSSLEQQLYTHLQFELSMCMVPQLSPTSSLEQQLYTHLKLKLSSVGTLPRGQSIARAQKLSRPFADPRTLHSTIARASGRSISTLDLRHGRRSREAEAGDELIHLLTLRASHAVIDP